MLRHLLLPSLLCAPALAAAMAVDPAISGIDALAAAQRARVLEWRRDFHQHPELGNRETRTSAKVVEVLRGLGFEVRSGIAHTGVTAYLRGRSERPLLALRADMDALPVTEQTGLPFASTATTTYRGERVGVMHACGHDAHTAILLGAAAALAERRATLPGSLLLVFQPAEEGPPDGEQGGAELMLQEGIFGGDRKPDAMLGLHVWSALNVGAIGLRSGPIMAQSDRLRIVVQGVQTHGSRPWGGIDPILAAARIVDGLQSVVARRVDVTQSPAVVSIGAIKGGIRYNIIPDSVEMVGTIRSFEAAARERVHADVRQIAEHTAQAHGATATTTIERHTPVNVNDARLASGLRSALARAAGTGGVVDMALVTGAEDFAFYAEQVPSLFFFVGSTPAGVDPRSAPSNHSPKFLLDEQALDVGLRALLQAAFAFFDAPDLVAPPAS